MPHVSVVMPAYNRAALIGQSIDSVLAQTFRDFELIVVDDGSTDATPEVLERYGPRLRVIRQANAGPAAAKNRGVREAAGPLVAFLDSDDLWLPDKLAAQVAFLDARPDVALVFCDICRFDTRGIVHPSQFDRLGLRRQPRQWAFDAHYVLLGDVFSYLLEETPIYVPAVVCRREAIERAGGFDPALRLSEDWELWMRLARQVRFGYTDRVLVRVRQHPDNISGDLAQRLLGEIRVLHRVVERHPDLTADQVHRIRRLLASRHSEVGYEHFRHNRLTAAREQFQWSLHYDPQQPLARRLHRWCRAPGWLLRALRASRALARGELRVGAGRL